MATEEDLEGDGVSFTQAVDEGLLFVDRHDRHLGSVLGFPIP